MTTMNEGIEIFQNVANCRSAVNAISRIMADYNENNYSNFDPLGESYGYPSYPDAPEPGPYRDRVNQVCQQTGVSIEGLLYWLAYCDSEAAIFTGGHWSSWGHYIAGWLTDIRI